MGEEGDSAGDIFEIILCFGLSELHVRDIFLKDVKFRLGNLRVIAEDIFCLE